MKTSEPREAAKETEQALKDLAWLHKHYPELCAVAVRRGLPVWKMIDRLVRRFDREASDKSGTLKTTFSADETGPLSYDAARELHGKLGRFFARTGAANTSSKEFSERGKEGAKKRWAKAAND